MVVGGSGRGYVTVPDAVGRQHGIVARAAGEKVDDFRIKPVMVRAATDTLNVFVAGAKAALLGSA